MPRRNPRPLPGRSAAPRSAWSARAPRPRQRAPGQERVPVRRREPAPEQEQEQEPSSSWWSWQSAGAGAAGAVVTGGATRAAMRDPGFLQRCLFGPQRHPLRLHGWLRRHRPGRDQLGRHQDHDGEENVRYQCEQARAYDSRQDGGSFGAVAGRRVRLPLLTSLPTAPPLNATRHESPAETLRTSLARGFRQRALRGSSAPHSVRRAAMAMSRLLRCLGRVDDLPWNPRCRPGRRAPRCRRLRW